MTDESKAAVPRAPTYGILSIAAPFIGAFMIFVLLWGIPDFPLSFILALFIIPLSPICGIGFAVAAGIRGERYFAIRAVGLLINLAVIALLIANRNHVIGSFG